MPASNSWVRGLVQHATRRGAVRAALLDALGLSDEELDDPLGYVSEARECSLWQEVQRSLDDPLLGSTFGCERTSPDFGVVGYLGRTGATWDDALATFVRFHRLLGMHSAEVCRTGETITFAFETSPALSRMRHPGEARIAAVLSMWRSHAGHDHRPLMVTTTHEPPRGDDYGVQLGAPVRFDAAAHSIVWRRAQAEACLRAPDVQSRHFFEQLAHRALESAPETLLEEVRMAAARNIERGPPSLDSVARELGIGPRTLQRRLAEASISFSSVVDQARRQRALGLIEKSSLSLAEIAYAVGFRDPSAFRKAFRRWVGYGPRAERRRRRSLRSVTAPSPQPERRSRAA